MRSHSLLILLLALVFLAASGGAAGASLLPRGQAGPGGPHLSTFGLQGDPGVVSSTLEQAEDHKELVERHFADVEDVGLPQGGNELKTSYSTQGGGTETVSSSRHEDETDKQFLKRHQAEVLERMLEVPLVTD